MTSFYNVIIGIATILIGSLAFAEQISKSKFLEWFNYLSFKIIVFIVASCFIIWATIEKDSNNETTANNEKEINQIELKKRDGILKAELSKRDSLHEKKELLSQENSSNNLIKSNNENFKTYTEVLAKYNLQLDSNNRRIIKLVRDSASQLSDVPFLRFCIDREPIVQLPDSNNYHIFQFKICNDSQYPSYDLKGSIYIFNLQKGSVNLISRVKILNSKSLGGNNTSRTKDILFPKNRILSDTLAFCVNATFLNSYGRSFPLKDKVWFSTKTNTLTTYQDMEVEKINQLLKELELSN